MRREIDRERDKKQRKRPHQRNHKKHFKYDPSNLKQAVNQLSHSCPGHVIKMRTQSSQIISELIYLNADVTKTNPRANRAVSS